MDTQWTTLVTNLCPRQHLEPGLRYARQGHVLSMELLRNRIVGRVQGRHTNSYRVEIRIKPFPGEIWDMVVTLLVQHATLATAIIDGELPSDVDTVFQNAGIFLFPQSPKEFVTTCSCSDNTTPCQHTIAIFCVLAQEFVKNPFILFMLRGTSHDDLLTALIEKRACIQQKSTLLLPEPVPTKEILSADEHSEIIFNYWLPAIKLDDILGKEETPLIAYNALQTLGNPPDWPSSQNIAEVLQPLYDHVSKKTR